MSTRYFLYTEIKIDGTWLCINERVPVVYNNNDLMMVPTFETSARTSFEAAYRNLSDDGYRLSVEEMSKNLQYEMKNTHYELSSPLFAVTYDKITAMLNKPGKEHCAFALRQEIIAFENYEEDQIYDYVTIKDYKTMDPELRKAYQYYEWNNRDSAYRFYSEIRDRVTTQLQLWRSVNYRSDYTEIRVILFIS